MHIAIYCNRYFCEVFYILPALVPISKSGNYIFLLDLERTWFGSEVRSVFLGSVGSRFRFWVQKGGSGGSRFSLKVRWTFRTFLNQENYLILTQFSVSLREKILKVGFSSDGSNCKIRFDPTLVFSFKKSGPFFSEIIP